MEARRRLVGVATWRHGALEARCKRADVKVWRYENQLSLSLEVVLIEMTTSDKVLQAVRSPQYRLLKPAPFYLLVIL